MLEERIILTFVWMEVNPAYFLSSDKLVLFLFGNEFRHLSLVGTMIVSSCMQ